MKRNAVLLVLLSLGCATSRGQTDLAGTPELRTVTAGAIGASEGGVSRSGTVYRYQEEVILVDDTVAGGFREAFSALQAALTAEGLVPDGMDADQGLLTLARVEWSRERNGEQLSDLLDCGLTSTGRPMANAARVVAALVAQVRDAGPHASRVVQRLNASAYPYENESGAVRACVTTGKLERRVVESLRRALAPGEMVVDTAGPGLRIGPPMPTVRGQPEAATAPVTPPALLTPGDQVRVRFLWGGRASGAYLQVRADTLVLGTGRRTPIPLVIVDAIQVKRTRRSVLLAAAAAGAAAGVVLATTTDLGIHGQHGIQGRILNPGLGALAGGVAGVLVANWTLGTAWIDVPLAAVRSR